MVIKATNHAIKPIFIVGVPRCGSTLVEKIITSGVQSISAGEEIGILSTFVKKKIIEIDGSFESGQFEIDSTYRNWSEVHIGPWYNRITLGIDIAGNAKLRSLDRVGGMIFWIIPFVAFETWDHRLNKLAEKQYFPTCEVKDYWSS